MNHFPVACALALLLAAGAPCAADDHRGFDCVAGFCVGDAFPVASADAGWNFADGPERERCARVSGGVLPPGVGMMVMEGRVVRFEIGLSDDTGAGSLPSAPFGLRRGMSLLEAGTRFPPEHLELDVHKYAWPGGIYVTWRDEAHDRGVRAELPDGTVEVILWGAADAVTLTEGCL